MSRDFRPIFFALKRFDLGHMNRQKRVCKLFRFYFDIRLRSSKIVCPRSQRLQRHANFSLDNYSHFKIIAIGFVNTPKNLFHLTVPLKSVRSLHSFSKVSAHSICRFRLMLFFVATKNCNLKKVLVVIIKTKNNTIEVNYRVVSSCYSSVPPI